MKPNRRSRTLTLGAAILALAWAGIAAAAGTSAAELNPSRITLDEDAVLRVATDGQPVALPAVDGLRFVPSGQSSETTIINGAVTQHAFRIYQVVAAHPGSYAIPIGGQTLRLEVVPAGSAPASPGRAATRAQPQGDERNGRSPLALLRVELGKRKLYVGQAVPITFKAYFRPGTEVTLSGAPSLGTPAFTISQLSEQPRQSIEPVGGVPYRVAAWTGVLSAAMPGSYPANATLPIVARYRELARRPAADPFAGMNDDDDDSPSSLLRSFMSRSPFAGGFDDPFAPVRERELTLRSAAQPIEVLPLPASGRPADFSGAVGQFDVRAALAPVTGAAFEPLSLTFTISGRGNFERVSTPGLPSSPSWKSYPPRVKPGAATAALDCAKVFEQAVVPQESGRVELPPVAFSFFDPDRGRYVTRASEPIAVTVAAAAPGSTASNSAAPLSAVDDSAAALAGGLRPNHADDGRSVATLAPPYQHAWFWLLLSVPLLGLAAAIVQARRRNRTPGPRAAKRALREALAGRRAEMRRAAGADDAARFFAAAQTALQAQLAARWQIAPDAVTAAEAHARMGEAGAAIVAALAAAEQLRYGGRMPRASSLTEYGEIIERQLDQLENRP